MAMKEQKITDEQLATARTKAPEAERVTILGKIQVVIRPPTRMEWRMYRQNALSPVLDKQAAADEGLFTACCLLPEPAALAAFLERYPALPSSAASVLAKMAGFDAKAESDF